MITAVMNRCWGARESALLYRAPSQFETLSVRRECCVNHCLHLIQNLGSLSVKLFLSDDALIPEAL